MENFEKFKNETLELNELIKLKGGELQGGDDTGCIDTEISYDGYNCIIDTRDHHYNDNGSYNGDIHRLIGY